MLRLILFFELVGARLLHLLYRVHHVFDHIAVVHGTGQLLLPHIDKCARHLLIVVLGHVASPDCCSFCWLVLVPKMKHKGLLYKIKRKKGVGMAKKTARNNEPVVVKKYANRRLYNTETSTYVTLEDLCDMVKEGTDFIVCDAKTGDDLTRQVLTQIIFEQESRGENLLPIGFLRNLIGFYDDSIKGFVPHYLENSMQTFITNQEKMREMMGMSQMTNPLGQMPNPLSQLEELGKQNMEFFSKAMESIFTPFASTDEKKK